MQAGGRFPLPAELHLDASKSCSQSNKAILNPNTSACVAFQGTQRTCARFSFQHVPPETNRLLPATPDTPQMFALPHDYASVTSGVLVTSTHALLGSVQGPESSSQSAFN
jgi:hypothetical protein